MGNPHEYKGSSQRVLGLVYEARIEATVNTEVLQEVLHFYRRRQMLGFGLGLFDRLLLLFPDPLPVTRNTMVITRDVLLQHPHLQARDAVHAAVVLEHGLKGIISADRAFDAIPGVTRFDPKSL
jgi:hypothetical protein